MHDTDAERWHEHSTVVAAFRAAVTTATFENHRRDYALAIPSSAQVSAVMKREAWPDATPSLARRLVVAILLIRLAAWWVSTEFGATQ